MSKKIPKSKESTITALVFILLLILSILTKSAFERKVVREQILDIKLYFVVTILNILLQAIFIGLIAALVIVVLNLLLILVSIPLKIDRLNHAIHKIWLLTKEKKARKYYCAFMLAVALFVPNVDMAEYEIAGEKVLPITALYYQLKDFAVQPQELIVEDCWATEYSYESFGRYARGAYEVQYCSYTYNGEFYQTPAASCVYQKLNVANMADDEAVKVLIYPNTGMVVDFVVE